MPEFTSEQRDLIAEFSRNSPLAGNAVAGSGKTTTMVAAMNARTPVSGIALAFNKRNADDLKAKIPPHFEARTFNALGHRVWGEHINKKLILDSDKDFKLLEETGIKCTWEERPALLQMVRIAKNYGLSCGILTLEPMDRSEWERRFDEHDGDIELFDDLFSRALVLLQKSIHEAWKGRIDFADQLYCPVLFDARFPRYKSAVVDEAQDLSGLQHAMVERIVGDQLAIIGDPHQAIYAFRGASSSSFDEMRERFHLPELPLTFSFRCPQSVAEIAKRWVPHFQVPEGAPEGTVNTLPSPPDRGTYLCRYNAPLITQAFRLLRSFRPMNYLGRDFIAGLSSLHKKHPTVDELKKWHQEKLDKSKTQGAKDRANDQYSSMLVLHQACSAQGKKVEDVLKLLGEGSKDPRAVTLSTIHKAKGMEWKEVSFLDYNPEREDGQEKNLLYVGVTRAQETLNLIPKESRYG